MAVSIQIAGVIFAACSCNKRGPTVSESMLII